MNIRGIYQEVEKRVKRVDFSLLWKGFKPLKFALYNDKECFFDGNYIEKTDQFLANTAITYKGETIAIWRLGKKTPDYDILASKIIHEMFHGFQQDNNETRFPNELEALQKYAYSVDNLTIKMKENSLINRLVDRFDQTAFNTLLQLRKRRQREHPYEYHYESLIEQIEGSASYIELEALRQLSKDTFNAALASTKKQIADFDNLIPIRIISYAVGGLLLSILKTHTSVDCEQFSDQPFSVDMLDDVKAYEGHIDENPAVKETIDQYHRKTKEMIDLALEKNHCVLEGKYPLVAVNVYNARRMDRYIISTYFVAYKHADKDEILHGDYLVELDDDSNVKRVYTLT